MPSTLGQYTCYETLGRGGQGLVKRAVDSEGNKYAIKILNLQEQNENTPR